MNVIKIYWCICTEGIFVYEAGSCGYSINPWGKNTAHIKGHDDGGQWYILPEGYFTREVKSGNEIIKIMYNENDNHCCLATVDGKPAIDDPDKEYFVFLRKLDELYGELERDNGYFVSEDKPYWLTEPAYPISEEKYQAPAIDIEGNVYIVTWETTQEWDDREDFDKEDESESCDWSNPVSIEFISTQENWEG